MIVLKENKAILHLMGLIPGIGVYLPVAVWSIPLITLLLPMIAYSIVNIHDVRKATDASYVIAADILCTGQYWFLAAQKTNLLNVLNHLDRLVAESRFFIFLNFRRICSHNPHQIIKKRKIKFCYRKILARFHCFWENWKENSILYQSDEGVCYYFLVDVPIFANFRCWLLLFTRNIFTKCMVFAI